MATATKEKSETNAKTVSSVPTVPKTFREHVWEVARLGRGGAWVRSTELADAVYDMKSLEDDYSGRCRVQVWDCVNGVHSDEEPEADADDFALPKAGGQSAALAMQLLRGVIDERKKFSDEQLSDAGCFILVLRNGHREIVNNSQTSKQLLTEMQISVEEGKQVGCLLVILAHASAEVPPELKEQLWQVEHELPDEKERRALLTQVQTAGNVEKPDKDKLDHIAKLTGGLTRNQMEGVVGISYLRHRRLCDVEIAMQKAKIINESGLLTIHKPAGGFETLGGFEAIKKFLKRIMREDRPSEAAPRGVLLLGLPGVGKSHIAKALGAEVGRPTLSLDLGALMGGIVGETEERTRQAIRIIDSMEPAIVYVDEIEKSMGGMGGGGGNDSGVSSRMLGTILTWLNDHTSDIFFIATANNASNLPKELTRAERFDAMFFMDQPSEEARDMIWDIYLNQYLIDKNDVRPNDVGWTGAEIKACCRLSRLLEVPLKEASRQVVPVAVTAAEQVDDLRSWADRRCIDAETGSIYLANEAISRGKKKTAKTVKKKAPRKRAMVN